jgi:hypothetical protein
MIKIESEEDYEKYLLEASNLMDVLCVSESVELEKRLVELADAIEEYESIHYPIDPPTEEAMKEFRKDQGIENL